MTLSRGLNSSIEVKQSHVFITHSIAPIILYLPRITRSCNSSASFHTFVTMCFSCVVVSRNRADIFLTSESNVNCPTSLHLAPGL